MLKSQEINDPQSCLNRAAEDEPVFVIRSKDPLARIAVNFWIGQAEIAGLHHDRLDEAKEWLKKSEKWLEEQEARIQLLAHTPFWNEGNVNDNV